MRRAAAAFATLVALASLATAHRAAAQATDDRRARPEKKDERTSSGGLVVPAVYYSPETKLALGVAGFYYFRLPGETLDDRPSNVDGDVIYTVNKQLLVQLTPTVYLSHGKLLIESEVSYERLFDRFYGVGPNTPQRNEETFNYDLLRVRFGLYRRLAPFAYFGMQYHAEHVEVTKRDREDANLATNPSVLGAGGSTVSGLGFRLTYDSRDNYLSATRGAYFGAVGMFYSSAMGGTHTYSLFTLDARKYFPLWWNHVFAIQGYAASTAWNVPFTQLPGLGGQFRMRGYFDGRFRDQNAIISQVEYRFPIVWRFGGVGFASAGVVAPGLLDFDFHDIKGTAGGGLRFMFDRDERLNGRFDVGVANDGTSAFYIQINEAF